MATILETDETGALHLPAEVLGAAKPGARYVVEAQGESLVLLPEATREPKKTQTPKEWLKEWRELSEQVTQAWNTDKSAAEIIAEMRR